MKRLLFTVIAIAFGIAAVQAQASKKTVKETCSCVDKIKSNLSEDAQAQEAYNCMINALQKNMEALLKEYKINNPDPDQAANEVATKFATQLVKDCPAIVPHLVKLSEAEKKAEEAQINPDTMKLDSKVCANYKSGKYRSKDIYINKKKTDNPDAETSYTEVNGTSVIDYSSNKKYITKWTIKWNSSCAWEQTFIESTEPQVKQLFKKGDKVVMTAIGSTKNGGLWVKMTLAGMEFIVLYEKMK